MKLKINKNEFFLHPKYNIISTLMIIHEKYCAKYIDKSVTLLYLIIISNDNEKDTDNSTDTDSLRSQSSNTGDYRSI